MQRTRATSIALFEGTLRGLTTGRGTGILTLPTTLTQPPSQTRAERRQINDLARTREVRVLSSASEPVVCAVIALRPSSILCRPLPTLRLLPAIPAIRVESHALRPERSVHDPRVFTFYPSMIATARHHPAEARSIFTGRQLSVKPVDGNCSRLCSFSMWQ